MKAARLLRVTFSPASARCQAYSSVSTTPVIDSGKKKHYPLVVIGGGAGGCSVAAKFCRKLGKGKVAVVEPAEYHYYQPMWTLVGSGVKTVDQSARAMETVLPQHCEWLKTRAVEFNPEKNIVHLENGDQLNYDFLVVAMGIQLNYDKVIVNPFYPEYARGRNTSFYPEYTCSRSIPFYPEYDYDRTLLRMCVASLETRGIHHKYLCTSSPTQEMVKASMRSEIVFKNVDGKETIDLKIDR